MSPPFHAIHMAHTRTHSSQLEMGKKDNRKLTLVVFKGFLRVMHVLLSLHIDAARLRIGKVKEAKRLPNKNKGRSKTSQKMDKK